MKSVILSLALVLVAGVTHAEQVGSVDTEFKFLGPNHKIVVEVFDDARVPGVSCFISRAKTGGIGGALGLAEDTSDSSVACRQVGAIRFTGPLPKVESIFSEKASLVFKYIKVVRMVDPKRNSLVYLVYSDLLLDGSPKNSITAVPVPATIKIPLK